MSEKSATGIGIIGSGFARTTQIPGFRACAQARIVAIASGHRENAERVAREFGIPHVEDDWRGVVSRPDVQLVSIVTPPVFHREMALAAFDAGKAVLCEKPMAMTADETAEMAARARQTKLFAHLDHELRFVPARRRLRELIADGRIGRIRHAKFTFRSDFRASAQRPWDWWSDARAGGGVLGAIGSHAVDTLRWLLDTEVAEVDARLMTHVSERPFGEAGELRRVTTDDEANLLLGFRDGHLTEGTTAAVSLSVVEPGEPIHRVEVFGSEGALRVEESGELFESRAGAYRWEPLEAERGELAEGMRDSSWSRGFTSFARAIVAALQAGQNYVEHAATFDDGHRIQLVLDAARRAHDTGHRQTIE